MIYEIAKIALANNEKNSFAYAMNSLLAEYIEGYIDSSKDKFNRLWEIACSCNRALAQEVLNFCVFESTAIYLAEKRGLEVPYRKVGNFKYEYIAKNHKDPRNYVV